MATAVADSAGAAEATLKETTSLADQSDHASTTCTDADFAVYIQHTHAATSAPGKNTARKKRDIRGEADQETLTIETSKIAKALNISNAELLRNKMQHSVMEILRKLSKQIPHRS